MELIPLLFVLLHFDFLTILNWAGYARGIGDESVKLISVDAGFSKSIYELAKKRPEKYLHRNEVKTFSCCITVN